jgi:hypothetical protein
MELAIQPVPLPVLLAASAKLVSAVDGDASWLFSSRNAFDRGNY